MGVGRFLCVAMPFALTVGAIIFLLVGTLAGVADKNMYVFRVDVENLSIDPVNVDNIVENFGIDVLKREAKSENITAANLGLGKVYDISLWGYCYVDQDDKRHCTKPKFDWANEALNETTIEDFGKAAGTEIDIPDELADALEIFAKVVKWTEVVFIAALLSLAIELVLGIFANCSRIMSCCTWIISGIAALLTIGAAGAATGMALTVVGAVEGTAKWYGVRAEMLPNYLAVIWIAAGLAVAASLFWVFTICCCAPSSGSRKSKKNRRSDAEKLLPGGNKGYAPLEGDHEMTTGYYNQNQSASQYGAPRAGGAPRADLAYEPYSHRA